MPRVAVIGSATRDRVVRGEASRLKWGGVAVYASLTFSRLGLDTGVLTNVAARDGAVVDLLAAAGVSVEAGDSEATTEFVNHVSGDQRRQELLARAVPISQQQLARIATNAGHVHLGPLHPLDFEPRAVSGLRGVERVSLDIQGYTRQLEAEKVRAGVSEHLGLALEQSDIVTASRDETELVEGFYGRDLGAVMGAHDIGQWLTTDGERGGWLLDHSGTRYEFSAVPVDEVADPTGAGDVFFAAYLTYHLYEGAGAGEALQRAAALTARQVAGRFIAADELSRGKPE